MVEFIEGLIMIIVPLLIVCIFLIRWWKDYKRTRKWFVLYDKKTKWWQLLVSVLFLMLSVLIILSAISVIEEENNVPIQIIPEQYNPWGWYI